MKKIELEAKILELEEKIKTFDAYNIEELIQSNKDLTQQVYDKEKIIKKLEPKIKDFENVEETIKEANKREKLLTEQVYEKEQFIRQIQQQQEEKIKEYQELGFKFNELAKLFDEHIKSSDDIIELSKLMLRNNLRTQELMAQKIKAFNGIKEGDN